MRFNFNHPAIIELYINTLSLHLLQERLGIIGPNGLTDELRKTVDETTHSFSISAQAAEQLFGSSDVVQDQLNAFTFTMGDA
jgi:hypothetical protein